MEIFQYAYLMVNEKLVSMLFSDLKGFTKIKSNDLKTKLVSFTETEILGHLLNSTNHIYFNTWGDAFYICSENPLALAEIALQMRDKIMNKDWVRFGLIEDLEIRIALHTQNAQIITQADGKITNVVGTGVDTTARIEPVTEANEVFCSKIFYQLLLNENPRNIKGIEVGRRMLAKGFGEMNLFRLIWTKENPQQISSSTIQSTPPMPLIRRERTDKERKDFLYQAFHTFQIYFQSALDQLSKSNPDVETSFRPINNTKFVCDVYLQGKHKIGCKIWIGGLSFRENSIMYSDAHFSIDSDNSFSESFQVEDNGFEIFLSPLMNIRYSQTQDKMSVEQAAEALWIRFIDHLKY